MIRTWSHSVRARAGSVLGTLGDPRDLEEMVPGCLVDGHLRWEKVTSMAHPARLCLVSDIGKYPVTNAQYARFVEATRGSPVSLAGRWKPPKEPITIP